VTIAAAANSLTRLHEVATSNRPDFVGSAIGSLAESIYVHLQGQLWVPPNERLTAPLSNATDVAYYDATVTRKYEERRTHRDRRQVKAGRKATEDDSGSDSEYEEREVVRWHPQQDVAYQRRRGARSAYLDDGTGRVRLSRHPAWTTGGGLRIVVDRFEREVGMASTFTGLIGGLASLAIGRTRTIGYHSIERIVRCDVSLDVAQHQRRRIQEQPRQPQHGTAPDAWAPSAPPCPQEEDECPMAEPVRIGGQGEAPLAGAAPLIEEMPPSAFAELPIRPLSSWSTQLEAYGMLTIRDGELVLVPSTAGSSSSWPWSTWWSAEPQPYIANITSDGSLSSTLSDSSVWWWRLKWAAALVCAIAVLGPTLFRSVFVKSTGSDKLQQLQRLSAKVVARATEIRRPREAWKQAVARARQQLM
jgi:hypothetical protein